MIITAPRNKVGTATKAIANVIGASGFVPTEQALLLSYRHELLMTGAALPKNF